MMSSSEHLFLESERSFTQHISLCPSTNCLYVRLLFFFKNEGVSDNTGESVFAFLHFAFQFLVRYGCIMCIKIERLDAYYMVESWRFKMF